jgi:hypothetical protein
MSAGSRQRSASNRSVGDQRRDYLQTPPSSFAGQSNLSVPQGVVLNDIPGYGDANNLLYAPNGTNPAYPTISTSSPHSNSLRPRAQTYADPAVTQQQQQQQQQQHHQAVQYQETYRRGTPGTPGTMAAPNHYHAPNAQRAAQGYVPPPPPPAVQTPGPGGLHLPPPPPRPPASASQQHGAWMPPPPSQQQAQYWQRQQQPYHHQQSNNPSSNREPRAYDPMAYSEYMSFAPLQDNQPLTSATYVPGGESFGPGVGIPPLYSNNDSLHPPGARPSIPHTPSFYRGASGDFSAAVSDPAVYAQHQRQGHVAQTNYPAPNGQQDYNHLTLSLAAHSSSTIAVSASSATKHLSCSPNTDITAAES